MKINLLRRFCLLFFAVIAISLNAQILEPVQWKFESNVISDDEIELTATATIDDGWHLYSQIIVEGIGPVPLRFEFAGDTTKYQRLGEVSEPTPHKEWDDIFEMDVYYFEKEVTFTQRIILLTPEEPLRIEMLAEGQVCSDAAGVCVPVGAEHTFSFNQAEVVALDIAEDGESAGSLWIFFWAAFVSGLLAVLMPCIFPMIPMTVSFFMHSTKSKAKARAEALFFSFSIIAIYTIIGVVISIFLGPAFINWLSTHWIPNVLFFAIFTIFAISFFGAFEMKLPSWIVNKADAGADKGGLIGAFFMAFTLVLISFSCTAPIVGTVLVEAARGSVLRPIVGMLGFSLAVAIPFGFFSFFPQKLNTLPKSGGWLNSVKVCLGFVELALGLKFLMIVDQTYHWGILERHTYLALWIVIFLLMGIYLLGGIKFRHDSELKYVGVGRLFFIILTFSFVLYLLPGLFGSPLKMLAGYLPPQTSLNFDIPNVVRSEAKEIKRVVNKANTTRTPSENDVRCEYPKYKDFLHLQHNLDGYFDLDQAIRCAQAQGKPVFIDFTGHGCVNCREMEATVWGDPRVLRRLRENYVIVALYVDDKKSLPDNEVYVSDYDNKRKKTIGAKNADIQVKHFGSNAQPNYILLDNRGDYTTIQEDILMPPRGHNLDVQSFIKFLDDGVAEFNRRHGIN
ncbi:MAG: thioredoxin family protein [Bacteroidales bacterium]|nr:thioredoxin family protein [Bacteroidales bacterium]